LIIYLFLFIFFVVVSGMVWCGGVCYLID